MKTVALHNLGCKVNGYEMDVMQQKLQENGYIIVPFDEAADIYIINTCTVTNIADRKSRQMLHRAKKRNPQSVVVAVGCYVQTGTEQVLQDLSVDIAIGNNKKGMIVEILDAYFASKEQKGSEVEAFCDHDYIIDINNTVNMRPCIWTSPESIPGLILKSRTDATSSAPIASFPLPGAGCEAESRRIFCRK